jgi:protein SCO1/2
MVETPLDAEHAGRGHEAYDVRLRPLIISGVSLAALAGLSLLAMWLLFDYLAARRARLEVALPPVFETGQLPPEPRLQVSPQQDLREVLSSEMAVLQSYGWVDRQAGIVRIPIGAGPRDRGAKLADGGWGMMTMKSSRSPWRFARRAAILYLLSSILLAVPAGAHHEEQHRPPGALAAIAFEQRLNEPVPAQLALRDEAGTAVQLGDYLGQKPVILTLNYYACPMLCPLVLEGLQRSLRVLSFTIGEQFDVVTVSIDPGETPALAAAAKARYVRDYGRSGAEVGWHFLTGDEASIQQLTQAVGFRYAYDAAKDQYAHAAGIMVLTPQGRISRYFYGIEFSPRDLRLALVEAAANTIGSPVDQLLLFCYRYDPATGRYTLVVRRALQLASLATVLSLAGFMVVMFRRERPQRSRAEARR